MASKDYHVDSIFVYQFYNGTEMLRLRLCISLTTILNSKENRIQEK